MTDDFKKQYHHPLWQKKRLEKLAEVGFKCDHCGNKEKELHVHHKLYKKSAKVWEYELYELRVLCDGCHKAIHFQWSEVDRLIKDMKFYNICPLELIGYLGATIEDFLDDVYDGPGPHKIDFKQYNPQGVAQYYGIPLGLLRMKNTDDHDAIYELRRRSRNLEMLFS